MTHLAYSMHEAAHMEKAGKTFNAAIKERNDKRIEGFTTEHSGC
jgi:hypothetical protein